MNEFELRILRTRNLNLRVTTIPAISKALAVDDIAKLQIKANGLYRNKLCESQIFINVNKEPKRSSSPAGMKNARI